jgi:mannitol-1-phosphate/altronate dehydrogenase
MTDTPKDDEVLDPDEEAGADLDAENGDDDEPVETPEEIKAQRDEYKRRLDKQRTAKAREARAAKRAGGDPKPKGDEDAAATAAAAALAEKDEQIAKLEAKANKATALSLATEVGFKNPAAGVRFIDFEDLDDPSDPDEIRGVLREALKENPGLKKAPTARADGGDGASSGPGTKSSFNDVIRRAAGRA